MSGFLRHARIINGHKSANLYAALDNLVDGAIEALAHADPRSHEAAALRGKLAAYREFRHLLLTSARYRPRLVGDPPLSPLIVTDPADDHSRAIAAAMARRDSQRPASPVGGEQQ